MLMSTFEGGSLFAYRKADNAIEVVYNLIDRVPLSSVIYRRHTVIFEDENSSEGLCFSLAIAISSTEHPP